MPTPRWIWLEQLAQDLRYGGRTLVRAPAFTATAILTLAIGLALTTGVFTAFNSYVLRSFAVRDPGNLYQVIWHTRVPPGGACAGATMTPSASGATSSPMRSGRSRALMSMAGVSSARRFAGYSEVTVVRTCGDIISRAAPRDGDPHAGPDQPRSCA